MTMLQKNASILRQFETASQYEWLETNGLGGWASSSVIFTNTRRYHGLLVAATLPPAERMALVSKLDETIVVDDQRIELATNLYRDGVISPAGNRYISKFTKSLFPEWTYEAAGVKLKKTIAMVQGENTTLVVYEIIKAPAGAVLELQPFLSVRKYHALMHANDAIHWDYNFDQGIFFNQPYDGTPRIFIKVPGSDFHPRPDWYRYFNYAVEQYRGLDFEEDLFTHGHFSMPIKKGDTIGIVISTENPAGKDAGHLLQQERARKEALLKNIPGDNTLQQLTLAADQFIVQRSLAAESEALKTVIAGYHWFADWGRDTMISLPGLCLSTGRFDDAKKIIMAFANNVSMGMLPNRFQDNGEAPEYNNVDGTLWYFIAVYKYLQASGDKKFILNEILPVLKDIIAWHYKGTRYQIHIDDDGLLYSGEPGVQLTWMDAKLGDWVVTPRTGKAVEIQALWYNVLYIFSELLTLNKEKTIAKDIKDKAAQVKESFLQQFWNKENGYLSDVVDGDNKDNSLRPNQLFAISLPFALVDGKQAKSALKIIAKELYTPVGLRTLPADDKSYTGTYGGDAARRDASYHQGTVWSWLLGAYVDAIIKVDGDKGKRQAKKVIKAFKYHLGEGGIGSVSEIFDADAPHHPRGCIAQAWGVAEVLRVIKEYDLV
jgi:predicted glycogen debranching enzyme